MKMYLTPLFCFLLLHPSFHGACQQRDLGPSLDLGGLPTAEAYAIKSQRQKSAATTLLVVGGLLFTLPIGIAISSDPSFDDLGTLAGISLTGGVAVLGSIPLFIASAKNRKNAQAAKVLLQWQKTPVLSAKAFPAVALRISL